MCILNVQNLSFIYLPSHLLRCLFLLCIIYQLSRKDLGNLDYVSWGMQIADNEFFLRQSHSIYLRQSTALPSLEYSGEIMHGSLQPRTPGLGDPPTPAFLAARTTSMWHHTWLNFYFFIEMGSCFVTQADLKLLSSSNPPTPASQSARIISMSYHTWQRMDLRGIFRLFDLPGTGTELGFVS